MEQTFLNQIAKRRGMTPDEYVQYLKDKGYALDAPESKPKDGDKELEPLAQRLKAELESMTQEELEAKWEELKHWNEVGPTIEEYLGTVTEDEVKAQEIAESQYSKRTKDLPANKLGQIVIKQACLEMSAWKEQQMIEKAVKWLGEHMINYREIWGGGWDGESYNQDAVDNSLIIDFKKAMEE